MHELWSKKNDEGEIPGLMEQGCVIYPLTTSDKECVTSVLAVSTPTLRGFLCVAQQVEVHLIEFFSRVEETYYISRCPTRPHGNSSSCAKKQVGSRSESMAAIFERTLDRDESR